MKKKLTVVVLALCAAIVLLIFGISTGSLEQLIGDKYADVSGYFGDIAENEAVVIPQPGMMRRMASMVSRYC